MPVPDPPTLALVRDERLPSTVATSGLDYVHPRDKRGDRRCDHCGVRISEGSRCIGCALVTP
jgi:hypothetical protein